MAVLTLPLGPLREDWFRSNVEQAEPVVCVQSGAQTTWVYTMLSETAMLYIGCTKSLGRRLSAHRSQKPWWPEIEQITADLICCLHHARQAEAYRIGVGRPLHNAAFPEEGRLFQHDWACAGSIALKQFEF
jgi:hypothetical protein